MEFMNEVCADRVVLSKRNTVLRGTIRSSVKATVRFSANIGWAPPEKGNLLFVITGEHLTEPLASELGFIKTLTGFYKYLRPFIANGRLVFEFETIPEVTGFQISPWNMSTAIVLEDVLLISEAAEFDFGIPPRRIVRKWHTLTPDGTRPLVANFLIRQSACGAECVVHCHKWFESMDAFARRAESPAFGRDDIYVETRTGELIPASLQRATPAFLTIPCSLDAYLHTIGDKSRNMIRKATKLGYEFRPVGPENFGQDIYEIRTSDPMRQGRPIPEYFYSNPPVSVVANSPVGCALHTEKFFGIFRDNRLVSYITLFLFGEFAQVNHILCHKEHVANGVMNLNVMHVVDELIKHHRHVKGLNYMYFSEPNRGIDVFRRSVGFKPEHFLAYDSVITMFTGEPSTRVEEAEVKPAKKAAKKRRHHLSEWTFVRERVSGDEALTLSVIASRIGRDLIALNAPSPDEFVSFLSLKLSELVADRPPGTCFMLPFPSRASESDSHGLSDYLVRRFKGNPVEEQGFQSGFKGTDFRALGYFDVDDASDAFCNGYLVLEKVTGEASGGRREFPSSDVADTAATSEAAPVLSAQAFVSAVSEPPSRLDRLQLVNEYRPLDEGWLVDGVAQMFFTVGATRIDIIDIKENEKFAWDHTLESSSERMWFYALTYVGRLLATWRVRGDNAARRMAVGLVSDFMDFTSIAANRQLIGKIPSADHSAGERVKVLLAFYQLIEAHNEPAMAAFRNRLVREIHYWSEWLVDEKNLGVGNHKLMGATVLIYVYSLLSGEAGTGYLETAAKRILDLAAHSFDKDGLCNENTIGYHNFNLFLYRNLLEVLNTLEVADQLRGTIEPLIARATRALELCVFPDGTIPPIGDSPRYALGLRSRNEAFCFYESGFAVVKRDDFYFSLTCGARTEWHKQMDDASIYLQYKGLDIVIDAGSHSYDYSNPYARCVTSSAGHSALVLSRFDGMPRHEIQAKYGPVSGRILKFEEGEDGVRIACSYSARGCSAVFTRFVFVGKVGEVVLVDSVEAPEAEDVVQRFILGPMIDAATGNGMVRLCGPGFEGSIIHAVESVDVYRGEEQEKVRGWSTYEFGKISATTGVDLRNGAGQNTFSTIIRLEGGGLEDCSKAARNFARRTDAFFSDLT